MYMPIKGKSYTKRNHIYMKFLILRIRRYEMIILYICISTLICMYEAFLYNEWFESYNENIYATIKTKTKKIYETIKTK